MTVTFESPMLWPARCISAYGSPATDHDRPRGGWLSQGRTLARSSQRVADLSFSETADLLKEQGCGIGSGATFEEIEFERSRAMELRGQVRSQMEFGNEERTPPQATGY